MCIRDRGLVICYIMGFIKGEVCPLGPDLADKSLKVPQTVSYTHLCNIIAPEHLEVCVEDPFGVLNEIRNAGSIFLGRNVPEALPFRIFSIVTGIGWLSFSVSLIAVVVTPMQGSMPSSM